jgi:hypothetical protein
MNRAEKIKLLKAVSNGTLSVKAAFVKPPIVFIGHPEGDVFPSDGKKYSKEQLDTFNHTIFILPPNGRE